MNRKKKIGPVLLFLCLAILGFAADLGTKKAVFQHLGFPDGRIQWLWKDVIGFQTSLNEGALFGLGEGQIPFFVIASFIALAAVTVWLFFEAYKNTLQTISLGLISAGILGNLWDRLALHGLIWPQILGLENLQGQPIHAVRDWILVMIGSYHWPNFNLADSFLVCGTALIIIDTLFFQGKNDKKDDSKDSEDLSEKNQGETQK